MPTIRIIAWLFALGLLVVAYARPSVAGDESFKVIVHPDNPSDSVDRELLRDIYLKKTTEWHGERARPVDLSSKFPARDEFTREVIGKSPAQLRTYWNQQVFSGKGVPPPEVESLGDVVSYVLAHPGAVGYLPAGADHGPAKVVEIE